MISRVPSSRWLMASERMASSVTTPPALRIACASPLFKPSIPYTFSLASMQATTAMWLAGWRHRQRAGECLRIPGVASQVLIGDAHVGPLRLVVRWMSGGREQPAGVVIPGAAPVNACPRKRQRTGCRALGGQARPPALPGLIGQWRRVASGSIGAISPPSRQDTYTPSLSGATGGSSRPGTGRPERATSMSEKTRWRWPRAATTLSESRRSDESTQPQATATGSATSAPGRESRFQESEPEQRVYRSSA
jgi:hypothetical protein